MTYQCRCFARWHMHVIVQNTELLRIQAKQGMPVFKYVHSTSSVLQVFDIKFCTVFGHV